MQWEVDLMVWIQSWLGDVGTAIASFFTLFGESFMIVLVLGFLYWCWDKRDGVRVGLNCLTALIWNAQFKSVYQRLRPYMEHAEIKCLKMVKPVAPDDPLLYDPNLQGYSFPSAHSTVAAVTYGSLAQTFRKKWITILCTALMVLVGISRFCVGVHYPTDVLVGWAMGLLAIVVMPWLQKKIKNTKLLYLLILAMSVPGIFFSTLEDYFSLLGLMIGFLAGTLYEQKYVHFENTRVWWRMVLRMVVGAAVFLGVSEGIKLLFDADYLTTVTLGAHMVRTGRYALACFVVMGPYPMLFRILDKKSVRKS